MRTKSEIIQQMLTHAKEGANQSTIQKKTIISPQYLYKYLEKLETAGYITLEQRGISKIYTTTKKGMQIRQTLIESHRNIRSILRQLEE